MNVQVVCCIGAGGSGSEARAAGGGEATGTASTLRPLNISSKGNAEVFVVVFTGAALAGVTASNASSKPVADVGVAAGASIDTLFEFD